MDVLTLPFKLPFLPVQGLIRVAELIQEEAEEQYRNPAAARRQLEEAEEALERGDISSEDMYQAEVEAIERFAEPARAAGSVVDPAGAANREADPGPEEAGTGANAEEE